MYGDRLMDHYRKPRNQEDPGEDAVEGENPSCGDHVEMSVETEEGRVAEVRHDEDACAVCTAAASIVSEEAAGMDVEDALDADHNWMEAELGTELSPMRRKCGMLPLKTLQKALDS
jgi:NifU homolog involved in Fe-S cluster formation